MTKEEPDPHILNRKKKRRRIILAVLLLVLLVVGLFVIAIVRLYTGEPVISVDYVAQWERISKPADYDPNLNAFFDYEKAIETVTETPAAIDFSDITWPGDMNDALIKTLHAWLNENDEALAHLKRGSTKSYCWIKDSYVDNYLGNYSTGLDLGYFRELAWAINWQAKLDASEGRTNDAIENLLAGYRFTSHIMGPKPMLYHLVVLAIRGMTIHSTLLMLDRAELDAETLQYLQEKLQQQFDTKNSELDFRHEKLAVLDMIQRVFTDDGRGNGWLLPDNATTMVFLSPALIYGANPPFSSRFRDLRNHAYATWLATAGPDRKESSAMTEKFFDHIEALKDKSFWQMRNEEAQSIERMKTTIEDYVVLFWEETAYSVLEIYQRLRAEQNALIATLAILRYGQDKGALPENLQQLVDAGYLNRLPLDPFSTGPLVYKVTGKDFILYSFAYDCDDDGGKRSRWGIGDDGGDQVFWPVEKRE